MADTIEAKIADVLLTRLGALTTTPATTIAMPNTEFTPPTSGIYLEANLLPNRNANYTIGTAEPTLRLGILQVTVHYPAKKGSIKPTDLAGQVVAHFARGTKLSIGVGTARVEIYEQPSIAPALQEPNKVRVPVMIPYRCEA